MTGDNFQIRGLSNQEVLASRAKYGANYIAHKKERRLITAIKGLAGEPMVVLLFVTAVVYLLSGKNGDALFLAVAIVLVAGISIYQDARSRDALEQLKAFTQPRSKVIREGAEIIINSTDLVVGDSLVVEEGNSVAADGTIVHSNDFSVDESVLTGESVPVLKDNDLNETMVFQGTTATSGRAILVVTAVGDRTRLGRIGRSLETILVEKTPLESQINDFVKKMVVIGVVVFAIVWAIDFFKSHDFLASLTQALTLAMSILPEEIPVAFTTFMALGAWRLLQMGIVVKQMKTVETLGSASVICTDKTGTLTENKMSLAKVYVPENDRFYTAEHFIEKKAKSLIRMAMWASEPVPFDPMEVALHEAYLKTGVPDERTAYHMLHEYPLGGKPPMMTHIFVNNDGNRIAAAKGAPEAILSVSRLDAEQKKAIATAVQALSADGYRVLGVGEAHFDGNNFPDTQQELQFAFCGLIAFYDPPKKNIGAVLKAFYRAGIAVKILTGDHALTTQSIAREIGFKGADHSINGDQIQTLTDEELQEEMKTTNIFSRMFPEAKLRVINALKAEHKIIAMTGDGVNDGPALKAAHIGIAMGKKGTEIAKEAASLVLLDDDLSKMVEAIAMGRRIYANLKKAIQYIISIHIPIILTVFIPLVMGWVYPNIFSPVHIIFFELVMGPTCSIIYENEPMEKYAMLQPPRPYSTTFFYWRELTLSIIQGLIITAGTLVVYNYAVYAALDEQVTRAMVFTCLLSANIWLTLVNRSFYYSLWTTVRYKNKLMLLVVSVTLTLTAVMLYLKPVATFFEFGHISTMRLMISAGIGFLSVIWLEALKWVKRLKISY